VLMQLVLDRHCCCPDTGMYIARLPAIVCHDRNAAHGGVVCTTASTSNLSVAGIA
jgi:hypothetical protein